MAGLAGDFCLLKKFQERLKRSGVTKQITIFGRLGNAVVNTRHAARDGADDTPPAQRPHEVLEKEMKFAVSHSESLFLRDRLVEVGEAQQSPTVASNPNGIASSSLGLRGTSYPG